MRKSNLKVGDKVTTEIYGAGENEILKITCINREKSIVEMGKYVCNYENIDKRYKYVNKDGTFEDITNE